MTRGHTTILGKWLERLETGSPQVREAIIEHTCERLRLMARRMLRRSPKVRRWAETDDVLQNALIRLHRSLAEVTPTDAQQFYGLAATQLRRELIDLARHFHGPMGLGNNTSEKGQEFAERQMEEPQNLNAWTEFHERIDRLSTDERDVVHLLWYSGATQGEAAKVLDISLATLKRRWQSARLRLSEAMECPE